MSTYVLATANAHKVREIRALLEPLEIELVDRPDTVPEVPENEDTLEGNARVKAAALCAATGLAAIADDTGLFVDVLDGRPGVRSARYAGDEASDAQNISRLLDELIDVAPDRRTARFRTVIAVVYPDGSSFSVDGVLTGRIGEARRGDGGFGYDPVFVIDEPGRTLAELTTSEKNAISHRGAALRALVEEFTRREGSSRRFHV